MNDKVTNWIKTWKPISDRIVVLPEEQKKETDHGIYMADTKQGEDKRLVGTILAVGEGRYGENGDLVPMESEVGDRVLFGKYAGEDVLVDEDLTISKYNGVKRDEQVLVTTVRQDSLLNTLPTV